MRKDEVSAAATGTDSLTQACVWLSALIAWVNDRNNRNNNSW